ncbi:MAG: hypothetical protein ACEPOW_10195 [Bacteroidales bacterium]
MKKILFLLPIIALFLTTTCKKNSYDVNPPISMEEEGTAINPIDNDLKQMATLCSMAYVSENDPSTLEDSLVYIINQINLATSDRWYVVWYGIDNSNSTVAYVAKSTKYTHTFALIIRGEEYKNLVNTVEGIDVFALNDYEFHNNKQISNPKVAIGPYLAFKELINLVGEDRLSFEKKTFTKFFQERFNDGNSVGKPINLYLAGHSTGGNMATLALPYFVQLMENGMLSNKSPLYIGGFSFGTPSIYTPEFVDFFNSKLLQYNDLKENLIIDYQRIFNPNDLFPIVFYGNFNGINDLNYPVSPDLGSAINSTIGRIGKVIKDKGIEYKPILKSGSSKVTKVPFTALVPDDLPNPIVSLNGYLQHVGFNHDINNYIKALGANPPR